jgi:hypothetical protein
VIGDTQVARRVCATLDDTVPGRVRHLVAPGDAQLLEVVAPTLRGAAVLIRDDVAALRYALALAHLAPSMPLTATIFDRTIATQLRSLLPQATVISPASSAVPSLAGPCLASDVIASFADGAERREVRADVEGAGLAEVSAPRPRATARTRLITKLQLDPRNHDAGTRLMLIGLVGLGLVLLADWTWLVALEGHSPDASFVDAARVVATVGPSASNVSGAYSTFSGAAMLVTIVLTALFTAGLVDRLFEPRLLRIVGSRAIPRGGHVIVVGMGQVGIRLCEALVDQGTSVVGVDRDRHAVGVRLARQLGIPVVIGDGSERAVLERVRVSRCLALAAVGSSDLDNIAVAVATSAVSASTRVVLRAGEQEAVAETRSLLPLGVIRDVTKIGATLVMAHALGRDALAVVSDGDQEFLRSADGAFVPFRVSPSEECVHATQMNASSLPQYGPVAGRSSRQERENCRL